MRSVCSYLVIRAVQKGNYPIGARGFFFKGLVVCDHGNEILLFQVLVP
jgi:hypothetical protein